MASEILQALAVGLEGRHGTKGEVIEFVLQGSSTGAFVVKENILNFVPCFKSGVLIKNPDNDIIGQSSKDLLKDNGIDLGPSFIGGIGGGGCRGTVNVVEDFISAGMKFE